MHFHHIGYASKSIDREIQVFGKIGYSLEGERFIDENQGVIGQFLVGNGPRMELLENINGRNTLTPILEKGMGMYHFGYQCENLNDSLKLANVQGAIIISEPKVSVAFHGKLIAFVMARNGFIIELIEL